MNEPKVAAAQGKLTPSAETVENGVDQPAPSAAPIFEGPCAECGTITKWYDEENADWCCSFCRAEIVAGQERDKRLDDPRRR